MQLDVLIATFGTFVGELYGNMVGGGSLVTQVVLQNIVGLDIKSAMALDNTMVIGSSVAMLFVFFKKYKIQWWFFLFAAFKMLGAYLGALVLIVIDVYLLKILFTVSIVLLVLKNLFVKEGKHKEKGFKVSYKNLIFLSCAAVFMGAYNAAFVIGDWVIGLLILTSIFAIRYQYAIFLMIFSEIFSQPVAAYQYYKNDLLDFDFLIPMICAALVAGAISANLLHKIHFEKLEKVLKCLSVFLVIYLIFSLFNF